MSETVKRAFDECPNCGARMIDAWAACGDDDPECECDTAWDCEACGRKYIAPCGAHMQSYDTTERELIADA